MFAATPPSQLTAEDGVFYVNQYNLLVQALNAPKGTKQQDSTDQASWARSELWGLWFKAKELAGEEDGESGEEGDEEEDEDVEMAASGDVVPAVTKGKKKYEVATVVDQGEIPGGVYSWNIDDHGMFRLLRKGEVVHFGLNE